MLARICPLHANAEAGPLLYYSSKRISQTLEGFKPAPEPEAQQQRAAQPGLAVGSAPLQSP